jgi:hypothetical protein
MWEAKAEVIPVIIGANGTISKSLRQYPSNIPAKHKFRNLKKGGGGNHTGHPHMLWEMLM